MLISVHSVSRARNGTLDLASLAKPIPGYSPDPIQRLENDHKDARVKVLIPKAYQPHITHAPNTALMDKLVGPLTPFEVTQRYMSDS